MRTTNEGLAARKGGSVKTLLLAAACASVLALSAIIPSAAAEVKSPRSIEAFYGRDLVLITGYPANARVKIDVLRNGVTAGSVTGRTGAAGTELAGTLEINHTGAGDCWNPPATPDIMPGDTVRTTVLNAQGKPTADRDTTVVRDIALDLDALSVNAAAGTITVSGHARSLPNAPIAPGADTLELRLNKANADNRWDVFPGGDQEREGRRDLRVDIGGNLDVNGNFTRTLNVGTDDAQDVQANGVDQIIEWSPAPAGAEEEIIPEITVFDEDEGVPPGCPPRVENAVTHRSLPLINGVNVAKGLTLGGTTRDATQVSVSLSDGTSTVTSEPPAVPRAAFTVEGVGTFQTWRATFTPQQLRSLKDGALRASAVYTVGGVEQSGLAMRFRKDVTAPARPTATPKPGAYSRTQFVTLDAERGARIHYTLNGKTPGAGSPVATRQIRIVKTSTLKAIAIDRAGNKSLVGSFRYRIL